MNSELLVAGALAAWNSNLERADKLFKNLNEVDLEESVAPGRNRLIYLWGHLSATHDRMLTLLGIADRIHPEFDEVFLASPDRAQPLPSAETVRAWWDEVNARIKQGVGGFSTNDWLARHTAVSEEDFAREPLRNRFSILLTRTNHLAYHIGQTALVRK